MTRLSILIVSYFFTLNSYSQSNLPAFGKADTKELLLKECAFEKDADAMKLLDVQETEITANGYYLKIELNRRVRIKILNEDGFSAANIIIPYVRRNRTSKINDISAYIYNFDSSGNITTQKLDKKQIFREKSEEGINKVAFTFPNVKAGSVIEYRYTHSERNIMHLDPWFFQDNMPTAVSVCKFIYPEHMKFDFRLITDDQVFEDYYTGTTKITKIFTLNNIRSFRPEPMMSSVKDNLQRVEFAFLPRTGPFDFILSRNNDEGRWGFYSSALLNYFFDSQIKTPIPGTEAIIDSARKILTKSDKVNFIYQSVRKKVSWDESQSFYPDDVKEVWRSGSGNSADINLTILNLLRKSDVEAFPVLISTRPNGKTDPNFISIGQFNGVDILILDSTNFYLLDGTQKYISFKTTPYNILNRDVLLVDMFDPKWVTISDSRSLMKTNIVVKAELSPNAELKGDARISYFDHSKANKLEDQNRKKSDEEKEEEDKEFIQKDFPDLIIDSLKEENADDELSPLLHTFNFTYKLSSTNDYFILDPFFLSSFRKNPFGDSVRRTDIDMGSNQSYTMYLHLTIPGEFVIEELPQNIMIRSSDSSMLFKREALRQGNILVFRNSFDINRPVYSKEEYPGIREYFKRIYDVFSDRIVLKKKN